MPKRVVVTMQSLSAYQQGKYIDAPKLPRETSDAHEERTCMERGHYTPEGRLFVPPMAFKKALDTSPQVSKEQIPGQGKARYAKVFLAGLRCTSGIVLDYTRESVPITWLLVPADGVKGGGKRVRKGFPTIPEWKGDVEFLIIDDLITKDVFERHCRIAGQLVGIGVWRAEKGGLNGLFEPLRFQWEEMLLG
jgi:hypothetical protein